MSEVSDKSVAQSVITDSDEKAELSNELDDTEEFYEFPDEHFTTKANQTENFFAWFSGLIEEDDNKSDTVELPEPEAFRENQWSFETNQCFRVGRFGCYYEGDTDNKQMHGFGRLILKDRKQFIEGKWARGQLIELDFAQLSHDLRNQTIFIVKQMNTYLITIREEKFVARAAFSPFSDLNFTKHISALKSSLFKKFTITDIIEDAIQSQRDSLLARFESSIKETASKDADAVNRAAILLLLRRHSRQRDAVKVLSAIVNDAHVPESLRFAARNLAEVENEFQDRKIDMFNLSIEVSERRCLDLREIILNTYIKGISEHRQMLINKCPNAFPKMILTIETLSLENLLYATKEDVAVFDHIFSLSESEQFLEFSEWLLDEFVGKLRDTKAFTPPNNVIPVMFPVYGFLFQSFSEVMSEICKGSDDCNVANLLKRKFGKWRLKGNIKWLDDEEVVTTKQKIMNFLKMAKKKTTLSRRMVEIQYRLLFDILMNSSPRKYNRTKKFFYDILKKSDLWQQAVVIARESGWEERLKGTPDERLVWLYILDHTVQELFKDGEQDGSTLSVVHLYAPVLHGYVCFVAKSDSTSYQSLRVLTHSILRFIASTVSYFRASQETPTVDTEILNLQMETITKASDEMGQDPSAFVGFKDLIEEYNRYWSLRLFITVNHPSGYFSCRINQVMNTFMNIVKISLKKSVRIQALVEYFRYLNDFADDFKDIDFTSSWFVKSDFYDSNAMERVDNKLSSGVNCSYRVKDIDKYIDALGTRPNLVPVPEHCILLIMSSLLNCIERCLEHAEATHHTQMQNTGLLLDAIRRSLMYLKDQPNYVDFETFKKESIDPFNSILSDTSVFNVNEFKKRMERIKESSWYIRKMDELGIDTAFEKLKSVNNCYISDELIGCYNLYLEKYNCYITHYNSLSSSGKSHIESMIAVRETIERPEPVKFTDWTDEFKTEKIPEILAGLSAIWSILVSKDVSSTGKFLKPHCIQLLCVMRLLSVGQSETCNHLAQVLTGQGKSVILGLLSSTLALTGHKVRVLCYSDYLSSRDQNDFEEFFNMFDVGNKIHYGTFQDMANGFLFPKCNGKQTSLRELVSERVLNHSEASLGTVTTESQDTVLLIDEVDVFFTNRFYGNVYSSCTTPKITGLAEVQEKMWSIANGDKCDPSEILKLTEKFINDEVKTGNLLCREFNAFRYKPCKQPLSLLFEEKDGNLRVKEYTNRTLIEEHLLKMAEAARLVGNGNGIKDFRLNDDGRICLLNSHGKYVTHTFQGYLNTFNYFRLKGSNYDHKNFKNYGYLMLSTGDISYARLPSQFKLILGVSGTLKDLSDYEETAIKCYDINNYSILPSFFGETNLQFDEYSNFKCLNNEQEWLKTIYEKTNLVVKSFRAALLFFDSETQLNLFSSDYKSKFDRFNEITENTDECVRDIRVNEAGLTGAVTLATRGMGRGTDFKSSLAVEKNGGIHVIQTFYSIDIKEEIQIKGRTARKDNQGSYELVLCKEHLIEERIISDDHTDSLTYSSLHTVRKEKVKQIGKQNATKIETSERNHRITMEYYGLSK